MADTKKFSEFTEVTPTSTTNIVGFENNINLKFPVSNLDLGELGGVINLDTQTEGILPISKGGTSADDQQGALNLITDSPNAENYRILRVLNGSAYWARQETNYRINGTFRNVFGGAPQIIGDVLEFGTAKTSATDHGSVFIPQLTATLTELTLKWVSGTPMTLTAGQTWTIDVYKLSATNADTTNAANWLFIANTNVSVDLSQNGYPYLKSSENIIFPVGDVYMFVLVETGDPIGSTSSEIDVYLSFRQKLDRY